MIKKISVILLSCGLFAVTTFAIANTVVQQRAKAEESAALAAIVQEDASLKTVIGDTNPSFQQAAAAIAQGGQTDEAVYDYACFLQIYQPTEAEQQAMGALLEGGASVEDVMAVYRFWLDTDKPVSMITQLYNVRPQVSEGEELPRHWIENAFNTLTNDESGVLTTEDIQSYIGQGLTTRDIQTANILSRKCRLTIQEILACKLGGQAWIDIAAQVYPFVTNRPVSFAGLNLETYRSITDYNTIANAIFLAQRTDKTLAYYLDYAVAHPEESLMSDYSQERTQNVARVMTLQGLQAEPEPESPDETAYLLQLAREKGLSNAQINGLQGEGIEPLDIANIALYMEHSGKSLEECKAEVVGQ